MGNTVGTKLTTIKDELGKKLDETKSRFDEALKYRETNGNETGTSTRNNLQYKKLPKISISGTKSALDLLDESIIDKSLRGDIEISKDNNYDDINDIYEDGILNDELNSSLVEEVVPPNVEISMYETTPKSYNSTSSINKKVTEANKLEKMLDNLAKDNKDVFALLVKGDDKKAKKQKKEILCVDDVCFTVDKAAVDIAKYCIPLLQVYFCGQTNSASRSDKADTRDVLNLGLYLKLVDKFLHQFRRVKEFTGEEEEYRRLLKLVSLKRKQALETTNQCFHRILSDSKRFVVIYQKRGVHSERLQHKKYWGSKQQMLSAKVIADWVDPEGGPLDPIFGAILQPTAGRCGPGDSGWIHDILFDDTGYMAYHSAVHDAFGYLINYHQIGPGYNYMSNSRLDKLNPLSGQLSGVKFWKEVIQDIETKKKIIKQFEI